MKRLYPLLFISVLIFLSCEEPKEEEVVVDTIPPTVTITSPQNGSTVSDSITITCMSSDNEGVEKVELWVNGVSTGVTDNTEPYSLNWNTITLEDGSFTIIIRSYDLSGNTTDSEPIILTVHNTPTEVTLWGVVYSVEDTDSLDLSESGLTGSIPPEIGNLTNLNSLNLGENQLTGSIPPEIGNLTNLTYLDLGGNQLTGEIPSEIVNLTNLERLYLERNELSGSIPLEIDNLTNLTHFRTGWNQLTGEIPSEIGNLTNLEILHLYLNELTGSIPPEIGNLSNLTLLVLGPNQLTGSIPSEIWNMTNLEILYLYDNELTGSIPPEIGNLTNLTWLDLGSNELTGEIPESICDLTVDFTDYHFNISNNQFCPPYPSCIEDYVGEQDTSDCS